MKLTVNGKEYPSGGPVSVEHTGAENIVTPSISAATISGAFQFRESFEDFMKRAQRAAKSVYTFRCFILGYKPKRGIQSKHSGKFRPFR